MSANITTGVVEKLLEGGFDQNNIKKEIQDAIRSDNDSKRKSKLNQEYNSMVQFGKANEGYENYALFVNQIFEKGNEANRDQFLMMLNKRFDNFEQYDIKFDSRFVNENNNNALMNEIFSVRNIDLLMESSPYLEYDMLDGKNLSERNNYFRALEIDPMLALEYLVSEKKNISKKSREELNKRIDDCINNPVFKPTENVRIESFLKEKLTSTDDVLSGIFMRKTVTPLGSLPAKKILNNVNNNINDFLERTNKKEVKIINESKIDFSLAKTAKELIGRLKKKAILAIAIVGTLLTTNQLTMATDNISEMRKHEELKNNVVLELSASQLTDYKIKEGDTLYSIARGLLSDQNKDFTNTDVANKVSEIVKNNPILKDNPDLISTHKKINLKM